MESTLSIFLELQESKQLKGENKPAVNVRQNCFYLYTPQSFPSWSCAWSHSTGQLEESSPYR